PRPTSRYLPTNKVHWALCAGRVSRLSHDMMDYSFSLCGRDCPMMDQVIANIAAPRQYCTEHHILVYYTAQPKEQSDEERALLNDMWGPGLTRSPAQQKVVEALTPDDAATVLVKCRYTPFHRPPLEQMLKDTRRNKLNIPRVFHAIG
ncbi:isochorismatase family protein, partial [Salmonella enterica]|uniref:isochorismatase family protein n=1 Tax=Salmonella enterica TaxID=28901 RepID=UPI00398C3CFD